MLVCLVGVTLTPYTRLPPTVASCAALLAVDRLASGRGRSSRLGHDARRWLVTLALLLTLAGAMFIPIPRTRPSFYVVLAATAVAAAVFAIAAPQTVDAEPY